MIHKMSVKCSYSSSTMIQTGLEINSFLMAVNAILSLVHQFLHTCNNTVRDVFSRFIYTYTAQKMKFSIKDFFSKCDQIRRKLRIWSHLLKKSLLENFIFLCSYGFCYFMLIQARCTKS